MTYTILRREKIVRETSDVSEVIMSNHENLNQNTKVLLHYITLTGGTPSLCTPNVRVNLLVGI